MTVLRFTLPLLAMLAGCLPGGDDDDSDPAARGCYEPGNIDLEGQVSVWVVSAVQLPSTSTEASELALNVDCDESDYADNNLGQVLAAVYSLESSNLNDEVQAMVDDGRLLHLLSVRATSLVDAGGVGVTLQHGLDVDGDPTDNFGGGEAFDIDSARGRGTVTGYVMSGGLNAHGGQLPVGIMLPTMDETLVLPLEAGRIEATIEGDVMYGRIGGAIPEEAVDLILIPFIHQALLHAIERDCPEGVCEPGSFGDTLIEFFDKAPVDGYVSLEEVRGNSLVDALFQPDVDLSGDVTNDALSFGMGFTAVPAAIR